MGAFVIMAAIFSYSPPLSMRKFQGHAGRAATTIVLTV